MVIGLVTDLTHSLTHSLTPLLRYPVAFFIHFICSLNSSIGHSPVPWKMPHKHALLDRSASQRGAESADRPGLVAVAGSVAPV